MAFWKKKTPLRRTSVGFKLSLREIYWFTSEWITLALYAIVYCKWLVIILVYIQLSHEYTIYFGLYFLSWTTSKEENFIKRGGTKKMLSPFTKDKNHRVEDFHWRYFREGLNKLVELFEQETIKVFNVKLHLSIISSSLLLSQVTSLTFWKP